MDQALDVAGNGAFGDAELAGETPVGEPGPARVQPFDEVLLALDPPQSQMGVARRGRRLSRGLIALSVAFVGIIGAAATCPGD